MHFLKWWPTLQHQRAPRRQDAAAVTAAPGLAENVALLAGYGVHTPQCPRLLVLSSEMPPQRHMHHGATRSIDLRYHIRFILALLST